MVRMNVSFKEPLAEELRRFVPSRQRSRFISEAVREKLNLVKQERAVRAAAGIWSSDGRSEPGEEIRALRGAWEDRGERLEGDSG